MLTTVLFLCCWLLRCTFLHNELPIKTRHTFTYDLWVHLVKSPLLRWSVANANLNSRFCFFCWPALFASWIFWVLEVLYLSFGLGLLFGNLATFSKDFKLEHRSPEITLNCPLASSLEKNLWMKTFCGQQTPEEEKIACVLVSEWIKQAKSKSLNWHSRPTRARFCQELRLESTTEKDQPLRNWDRRACVNLTKLRGNARALQAVSWAESCSYALLASWDPPLFWNWGRSLLFVTDRLAGKTETFCFAFQLSFETEFMCTLCFMHVTHITHVVE